MALRLPLACAVVIALSQPAAAQCLLCPPTPGASADRDRPAPRALSLTVTADLDFSRVTAGSAGGTVDLDPYSTRRVTQGGVVDLGGLPFTGAVEVRGEPGAVIRVTLPERITLSGDTGEVTVTDIRTNLGPVTRIGGDGTLSFRFGGRMQVSGDQDGTFRGRIPITADYM